MKKAKTNTAAAVADAPLQSNDGVPFPKPAPGEFKIVPWRKVRPDPNQPRKDFNREKLEELADSIRDQGIICPLIVQFMPAKLKIEEPNLMHDDWQAIDQHGAVVFNGTEPNVKMLADRDAEDFYQITDGERRWRAAELASLTEVPVIVRELTEREVFIHQFIANQARENLSHIEEARSFAEQIDKRKATDPAFNADRLAAELKIARGTVYNRLTLTRLIAPVLEALQAGKIHTSVAGLVAMIPDPKQQEKLLAEITNEEAWEYPFSFRDVEETIEEEYCKQLKDAPFDLKDPDLFGGAVAVKGKWVRDGVTFDEVEFTACTACPHRTGNMKEAFPHIKNVNVCTKPGCFASKCKAHFADEAAAAAKKGQKVLTPKEFKPAKSQYVEGKRWEYASNRSGTFDELMGKHKPEPVLVVTDEGLKKFYLKEDAVAAARKNGVKFHAASKPQTPADKAKEAEKQKEAAEREERRRGLMMDMVPQLAKGLSAMKDKEAWELAGEMVEQAGGNSWTDEELENALNRAATGAKGKLLSTLIAAEELDPLDGGGTWVKDNVSFWKRAGVDLEAEDKLRESATVKEPVLKLPKAEPKQKQLLTVKKNKKKK